MSDIFISYATEDRERTRPIVDALKHRGWSVFWDRNVPPGKKWDDILHVQLEQARCIVVLWSQHSTKSEWVRHEAGIGRFRHILVPVLLDDDSQVTAAIPATLHTIQLAKLAVLADSSSVDFTPLLCSVSQTLSRSGAIAKWTVAILGTAALLLFSYIAYRPLAILRVAARTGLKRVEQGKYTTGENERLGGAIRNAKQIKLLVANANSFTNAFGSDIREFFAKPGASMQVLFATADSEFYKEGTQMTYGADWNEKQKSEAYQGNMARVAVSRQILMTDAVDESKVQFKYFNTEFRLPVIIVDDKFCFLTIRLPPDDGTQSLRLEFDGGDPGYIQACVKHFDLLWKRGSTQPLRNQP
ncbi:MAG: toll/interleukin-1 receptor domain-containing protein [Candidatus Acidiferrum sp.]|jgi:hypothetical protein